MNNLYKTIFCVLTLSFIMRFANSQQINTLYFMEDIPLRHMLNPAFQPQTKFYISLPVLGLTQMGFGNNSFSIQDVIYKKNNQTISFLHPDGNVDAFYNKLNPTTKLNADFNTSLLSLGIVNNYSFWNFSLVQKFESSVFIPKDLFKLAFYGTPEFFNNNFNFNTLQANLRYYTEASLGYSVQINEQWKVGGKIKFLYGTADMSLYNSDLSLQADLEKWSLTGNGAINYSGPAQITSGDNLSSILLALPTNNTDWFKPYGIGGAFDLGFELRLTDNFYLSGSLTDIGLIKWTKNATNVNYVSDYLFDGVANLNSSMDLTTLNAVFNELGNIQFITSTIASNFENSIQLNTVNQHYVTRTTATLNIGGEYKFLSNNMSLGVLYNEQVGSNYRVKEISTSINAHPLKWFNTSFSYSLLNGYNTFGVGLSATIGPVNLFAAADYFPYLKTTLPSLKINNEVSFQNIPLAYNLKYFNIAGGINIIFGDITTNRNITTKSTSNRRMNPRTGLFRSKFKNKDCNCDWR